MKKDIYEKMALYAVKYSKAIAAEQYRHSKDEEKCAMTEHRYGDIRGRYVIYRGETATVDNIQYLNVEEYLKTLGALAGATR